MKLWKKIGKKMPVSNIYDNSYNLIIILMGKNKKFDFPYK